MMQISHSKYETIRNPPEEEVFQIFYTQYFVKAEMLNRLIGYKKKDIEEARFLINKTFGKK